MAHQPFSRGVTQLMYVGDDGLPAASHPKAKDFLIPAGLGLVAYKTRGILRWGSLAGAIYFAYQAMRDTHAA